MHHAAIDTDLGRGRNSTLAWRIRSKVRSAVAELLVEASPRVDAAQKFMFCHWVSLPQEKATSPAGALIGEPLVGPRAKGSLLSVLSLR